MVDILRSAYILHVPYVYRKKKNFTLQIRFCKKGEEVDSEVGCSVGLRLPENFTNSEYSLTNLSRLSTLFSCKNSLSEKYSVPIILIALDLISISFTNSIFLIFFAGIRNIQKKIGNENLDMKHKNCFLSHEVSCRSCSHYYLLILFDRSVFISKLYRPILSRLV